MNILRFFFLLDLRPLDGYLLAYLYNNYTLMGFKDQMNFKTFHLKVPNDVVNEIHWNSILEIKNQIQ